MLRRAARALKRPKLRSNTSKVTIFVIHRLIEKFAWKSTEIPSDKDLDSKKDESKLPDEEKNVNESESKDTGKRQGNRCSRPSRDLTFRIIKRVGDN